MRADRVILSFIRFNRQGRATAYGHRFTAGRVGNLRRHWGIPCFEPTVGAPEGELLNIKKAAVMLGVAPSTIHRLLNDGIIAGEQPTPGAPWRIRLRRIVYRTSLGAVSAVGGVVIRTISYRHHSFLRPVSKSLASARLCS